jgi:bifunctional non-homologous end joining protein LigD
MVSTPTYDGRNASIPLERPSNTNNLAGVTNPGFVPPMLAKLVKELPEGPQWEYELKLDGYRLEAVKDGDKVRLYSRNGNDFTKRFAPIGARLTWLVSRLR